MRKAPGIFVFFLGSVLIAQPHFSIQVPGFHNPVALAALPDGTVLVLQENGRIFRVTLHPATKTPWAEVWSQPPLGSVQRIASGLALINEGEGVLEVAVFVTELDPDNDLAISRVVSIKESNDPETGTVGVKGWGILVDSIPGSNVAIGGALALSPDGYLYIGTGSVGVNDLAQNTTSLAGKVLRVKVERGAGSPRVPIVPEIFALGLHSPAGLAFHPLTGRLYAADTGPRPPLGRNWDEINVLRQHGNYGWPLAFGSRRVAGILPPVAHSTSVKLWDPGGVAFLPSGPWRHSLVWSGMGAQALFRVTLDPADPYKVLFFEELFTRRFGRLRAVAALGDGRLIVGTDNSTEESPNADNLIVLTPR